MGSLSAASFSYGDPRGNHWPSASAVALAGWPATAALRRTTEQVIIVAGVAQALSLLARVLNQSGLTAVAVEDPGSLGTRQQLQDWDLDTPPVAVDPGGLRVDELRACGAPAVMLTPAHQFPTGVVLDGARRRELWQWARDGGLIIEDDYDAEHRYDRPPVPALRAALPDRVCYAGSVSKLLAPALRIGWLLVPPGYHEDLVAAKRRADLGSAVLPQLVLADLMGSGELEHHLRLLRKHHVHRRDAMIAGRRHPPAAGAHSTAPRPPCTLTVTFDDLPSDTGAADSAIADAALERGVKLQPLSWHCQRPQRPGLVLGYAASTPAQIADGIGIVGQALRATHGPRSWSSQQPQAARSGQGRSRAVWPQVSGTASDSMPSPKSTSRSDSAVTAISWPAGSVPSVQAVPLVGDGQASRTNHASLSSSGDGRTRELLRSSQAERHHPVAPVPVDTMSPEDACGSDRPSGSRSV